MDAIGGYFGLEELDSVECFEFHNGMLFQSARAALLAFLRARKPKNIWMPYYLCDSLIVPISNEFNVNFYHISGNFLPGNGIELDDNDVLLFVNYFSICSNQVKEVLRRYGADNVILDCSQAFYYKNEDCLASFYSPRKFFGVPDGGVLFSKCPVKSPEVLDTGSQMRTAHLLMRVSSGPEAGYAEYQAAEMSLEECEPLGMSELTSGMLKKIKINDAKNKRNSNFKYLHKKLRDVNALTICSESVNGPLCYPLLIDEGHKLKLKLIKERVYVPTYWPDVAGRDCNVFERMLISDLIALPCDQRYSFHEMDRIINLIARGI